MTNTIQAHFLRHPFQVLQRSSPSISRRVKQVALAAISVGLAGAFAYLKMNNSASERTLEALQNPSDDLQKPFADLGMDNSKIEITKTSEALQGFSGVKKNLLIAGLVALAAWRVSSLKSNPITPEKIKQQFEDLGYPFYFERKSLVSKWSRKTLEDIRDALDSGVANWFDSFIDRPEGIEGSFPIQFVGVAAANRADPYALKTMMYDSQDPSGTYSTTAEKILTVVNRGEGDVAKQIIDIAKKDGRSLNFYPIEKDPKPRTTKPKMDPEEMKKQFESCGYSCDFELQKLCNPKAIFEAIENNEFGRLAGNFPVQMIGLAAAYGASADVIRMMLNDQEQGFRYYRAHEILEVVQKGGDDAARKIINIVQNNIGKGKKEGKTTSLSLILKNGG